MKTRCTRNFMSMLKGVVYFSVLILLVASCLKDDTAQKIADHDKAFQLMKAKYGFNESDSIGDNIYVHYTNMPDTGASAVYAADSDYVVMDLEEYDSQSNLIAVTDSAVAAQHSVYHNYYIYGPYRVNINKTFLGFYKAIQKVPEGWSATMLFPYDQANTNYEPLVYKIKLYRVIKDLDTYEQKEYIDYRNLMGLTDIDTVPGFDSVYSKVTIPSDSAVDIQVGQVVSVILYGYYAEADTAYVHRFPGRQFFPIQNSGNAVNFIKGTLGFPVTQIVDDIVDIMHIGEERVVLTPAKYAYGSNGFIHPYTGAFLIVPDMPLHYRIKLVGVSDI
jgi:hypothetical protein